jgi:hypothetical protein
VKHLVFIGLTAVPLAGCVTPPLKTVKDGNKITFAFEAPVCAGGSPGTGQSCFFFGLVSPNPPVSITASVEETPGTLHNVPARAA